MADFLYAYLLIRESGFSGDYLTCYLGGTAAADAVTSKAIGLLQTQDYAKAELALRSTISRGVHSDRIYALLFFASGKQGGMIEAIPVLETAATSYPDSVRIFILRAVTKALAYKQYQEALADLDASIARGYPINNEVCLAYGVWNLELQRYSVALSWFDRIADLDDPKGDRTVCVSICKAFCNAGLHRYDTALAMIENASRILGYRYGDFLFLEASCRFKMGDRIRAIECLRAALAKPMLYEKHRERIKELLENVRKGSAPRE